MRSLLRDSCPSDYLTAAAAGLGLTGRAAELNAALEVPDSQARAGGVLRPLGRCSRIVKRSMRRAASERQRASKGLSPDTAALDGSIAQRPILAAVCSASESWTR